MKKAETTTTTVPCFECENGALHAVVEDYTTTLPEFGKVIVQNVPMERCDECGDTVIGDAGHKFIENYLDKLTGAITPSEIQAFLDKYSITQKEAAEITGYGEKNISRWLRGHMRPSKSVSNNLRTLLASKEAFEILKNRNWDHSEPIKMVIEDRQPDDEEKKILSFVDYKAMVAMGLVAKSQSPRVRRSEICKLFHKSTLQEVQEVVQNSWQKAAAYRDTNQASNQISSGLWCWIGEQAAASISVEPYDREKLSKAVQSLREYTQHDIIQIIPEVQEILMKAGVALVFVPIMRGAALRGCTKLVSPAKAVIVHGLKYRNHAQFWRILFHEIAHLMLHLSEAGESIADYENQQDDPKEQEADQWADDTLVSSSELTRFAVRQPKPENWQIQNFAKTIKTHPAIVAEIFNKRAGKEVVKYSLLRMNKLFPSIPIEGVKALGRELGKRKNSFAAARRE